jgi:hypothetical protein
LRAISEANGRTRRDRVKVRFTGIAPVLEKGKSGKWNDTPWLARPSDGRICYMRCSAAKYPDAMNKQLAACIVAFAFDFPPLKLMAQAPQAAPERHPGYAALEHFVGRWTMKGREKSFDEKCAWFDGRFHVVCHTEVRHPNGSTTRSMSVLGFVPQDSAYTYQGISSRGRNEIRRGEYRDGIFYLVNESSHGGKRVVSRVRAGPFDKREVPFVVESSVDGGPWTLNASETYLKLE